MPLVDLHLDLLEHSNWWLGVGLLTSVALLAYAFLARRKPVIAPGQIDPDPLTLFGIGLPVLAGGAGALTLLLLPLIAWAHGTFSHHPQTTSVLPLFLLVLLSAAIVLFYRGVYGTLTPRRRATLILFRIAGIAALVLLLFRPVLAIVDSADSGKPLLRILIDASASMSYNDAPNQPNRFRQSVIATETTLLPRLQSAYRLQIFAYDGTHTAPLPSTGDLESIVPDGQVTDLGAALSLSASTDVANSSAATVLLSDGIHNGPINIQTELAHMGSSSAPVHTIRVGSSEMEPSSVPDIAVVSIDGPQTAIINNQVTLTATIKSTAMSDRTVTVQLRTKDAAAKPLEEQRLVLKSSGGLNSGGGQTVQFQFTPDQVGRATVQVQVPFDPVERSDANNQQDFSLLVTDPKLTVLYVEGRVRPEVGALRRALEQDPNLAATSMVQTVAGRFELSGTRSGGAGDELKGLPTTLAQWKRFKVILLGDLDASFLSIQQQKDLEQTVRDGAGLLMIGGQNSFAPGGWDKTTLASLLPVSLEKVTPAQINTPFVPQLTAIGEAHPIFRNIAAYFPTAARSTPEKNDPALPDLTGCVALAGAKPGATILAVHPKEKINNEPAIVLAVQQYGKGRTAAFAADTTFRWSLVLRGMQKESPYNRFWGQMIRWLASEENLDRKTGASVTAMMSKERFQPDEPVALRAAVTDKDGQATNFAQTWADITGPDGKSTRVPLTPQNASANAGEGAIGIYQSTAEGYKPSMAGNYQVTFAAIKDGTDLGKDTSTFIVLPAAGERDVLAAQPRTLETISRLTGGTSVDLASIDALADRLLASAPQPAAAAAHMVPLSSPRSFFLLFITCLATEWFLRRRWQLH